MRVFWRRVIQRLICWTDKFVSSRLCKVDVNVSYDVHPDGEFKSSDQVRVIIIIDGDLVLWLPDRLGTELAIPQQQTSARQRASMTCRSRVKYLGGLTRVMSSPSRRFKSCRSQLDIPDLEIGNERDQWHCDVEKYVSMEKGAFGECSYPR